MHAIQKYIFIVPIYSASEMRRQKLMFSFCVRHEWYKKNDCIIQNIIIKTLLGRMYTLYNI